MCLSAPSTAKPTTCPLRNLHARQEATIRTRHGTMDWFKIGKGVCQDCLLSPCSLTCIQSTPCKMPNESQAGIKIAQRNNNNLRYADDIILTAESKEELKNLSMGVKEESEKACLKLSIQKTKIMASDPISSWQIGGEKVEAVKILYSWHLKSLWTVTAAI